MVVRLKLVSLVSVAGATDRRYIDHAVPPLNVNAGLHRNVELLNVGETELTEFVKLILADVALEALLGELLTILESLKTVL